MAKKTIDSTIVLSAMTSAAAIAIANSPAFIPPLKELVNAKLSLNFIISELESSVAKIEEKLKSFSQADIESEIGTNSALEFKGSLYSVSSKHKVIVTKDEAQLKALRESSNAIDDFFKEKTSYVFDVKKFLDDKRHGLVSAALDACITVSNEDFVDIKVVK